MSELASILVVDDEPIMQEILGEFLREEGYVVDVAGSGEEGLERCREVLDEHVSEVRVSERLIDSPVCLVLPKGGLPAHLERLIRAQQKDLPPQKRILELNPEHSLVKRLRDEHAADASSGRLTEWIELLHDQALLAEGSPLPDPARFATRFAAMMERATQ